MPDVSSEDDNNAERKLVIIAYEDRGVQNLKTIEDNDSSSMNDVKVYALGTDEALLETDPYFVIPKFESLLYATVLENVIFSFTILNTCNNHLRLLKSYNDLPLLMTDKFGIAKPAIVPNELDLIDPKRLNSDEYKLFKLDRDREDVKRALQETYKSMALLQTFRPLWNFCQRVMEIETYRENLIDDTTKNKANARTLHRQLRQLRVQQTTARLESDAVIDELRTQIQDAEHISAVKERYVCKWQTARTEQQCKEIEQAEGDYSNSIRYYKERSEQEGIVHGQVELLVHIAIEENLQKIEAIMAKYDRDLEQIDLKIQILTSENHKITEQRQQLAELLKTRTQEMKDWIKFKEDRAKARKYHDKMTGSAIAVQAWWRGILVRKQLGPFRPAKESVEERKSSKKNEKARKKNKKA